MFRTCLSWIKAGTDLKLLRDDQKIDGRGPKRNFSEVGVPRFSELDSGWYRYIYKENLENR